MIQVKCIVDDINIELPKYETDGASGMDIRAWKYSLPDNLGVALDFPENGLKLRTLDRVLIKTGLHMEIPQGYEAQVRCRSGLALKQGLAVVNGVGTIDADYRGDIGVILINLNKNAVTINKGDRIAQLVFQKVESASLYIDRNLSETERGEGGFSSTGIK